MPQDILFTLAKAAHSTEDWDRYTCEYCDGDHDGQYGTLTLIEKPEDGEGNSASAPFYNFTFNMTGSTFTLDYFTDFVDKPVWSKKFNITGVTLTPAE